MASRFQATPLVASPLYPNAIAWSDENFIAVACGHLVTILNPALPFGPRGLITVPTCVPYPIGVVKREDLLTGCLLSTALSRDRRPCVRSISWSPIGMASNAGCLLAICTIEGRVKLFRPPFSDFCAEWLEVIDISDKLFDYLANTKFGESNMSGSGLTHVQTTQIESTGDGANVFRSCTTKKDRKRRHDGAVNSINKVSRNVRASETVMNGEQLAMVTETKSVKKKNVPDRCLPPQITAEEYASRDAMLSSIVVAWSPVLCLSSKIDLVPQNDSSHRFSILAVGGKSGQISFWRIYVPDCYSMKYSRVPGVVFLGILKAHNSWVTAINWAYIGSDSNPQVLLVSGSSDGSVKIWLANCEKLTESSEDNNVPFFLLKEVISGNAVPVSVLSLATPVQAPDKMLLAVGKGSGSFEVWECDISSGKFSKVGSHDAHDYVVTGLAWAFDGCCLYSCSQDNYVRCWQSHGNSLCEVPIPASTLGLRSSTDLPDVSISCLGVAVSPGNLSLAVVRNLDVDQLDHMYEARAHKAIVEFFWIGGQQLDVFSDTSPKIGNELVSWESNILRSLKKFENADKPLVIWDIIATLLAFQQCMPEYVNHILARWLSMTFLDSNVALSIDEVLTRIADNFSMMTSRQLHLLNVISRCLVLSELTDNEINNEVNQEVTGVAGEHLTLWIEILFTSEKELHERLVGFSFFAFLAETSSQPGYWHPTGVAQMVQWVNHDKVRNELKVLTSRVEKHKKRLSSSEYGEEKCSYCAAAVPFDSSETAVCRGLEGSNKDAEKHKLVRCAVSMQVCPALPLWFCKCCNRSASQLAPEPLFTLTGYPPDFEFFVSERRLKPMCPFCGILLQRLQPFFLLSASPV